jgi:hypothetical protein
MSGIKGFRGFLAVGLASAAAVLAVPGGASATTGIEVNVALQVNLTKHGVVFSRKIKATTDTTLEMRITNKTAKPRAFRIGNRVTHFIPPGQSEKLFYSFFIAGKVPWHSVASGAKHYRGAFVVHIPPRFGIPQE